MQTYALCIDIGNSNIKFGLFHGRDLKLVFRIDSDKDKNIDHYRDLLLTEIKQRTITFDSITRIAICSVVDPLTDIFSDLLAQTFNCQPYVITHKSRFGFEICVDYPEQVGIDRLVNCVAAIEKQNLPTLIIDYGTAITFDVVTIDRKFLGGIIAPGIKLSVDALSRNASNLMEVPLVFPEHIIGKNTTEAMQSGVLYGMIALTEGLINRIQNEVNMDMTIIGTGGFAQMISQQTCCFDEICHNLTLTGIRIISDSVTR